MWDRLCNTLKLSKCVCCRRQAISGGDEATKYPVRKISESQFGEFRGWLESRGFSFEERPHQAFLARKEGVVANLYTNGKVVLGGSDDVGIGEVTGYLDSLGSEQLVSTKEEPPALGVAGTRIGTDEVGKGDYFGPLVVAGALITSETEPVLKDLGVRDSKTMSDTSIANMAIKIRRILGQNNYEEIWISPLKYNLLYQKLRNVNRILGWAHARAIENLLSSGTECGTAIADQFGDESFIEDALMRKGRQVRLVQVPKAERDIAVAAASVLAREVFLRKREEMQRSYGLEFPKGATDVVTFGKGLVETHGIGVLQNVAKLHFSTTKRITDGTVPIVSADVQARADLEVVPREPTEKELREAALEIFNLIDNFEREFRSFMKEAFAKHYGDAWWEKAVDEQIRKKCEQLQRDEARKGRKVEPMDCLDFQHYGIIITQRDNWESVFKPIFKTKDKVLARLTVLKDWRDPVYHARGMIGYQEKSEVASATGQLRRMMYMQTGLDEF